jgi:hypothetical protein
MISTSNIILKGMRSELGGYKNTKDERLHYPVKLDDKMMEKIEESEITLDEFIVMEQFAKYLPRGKRKLKLNLSELKTELLSNINLNPLTDSDGLRTGGTASMKGNMKAKPKLATKNIKEMEQKAFNFSIKNKNRVKSSYNLNNGDNPRYTSFKNNFKI